MSGLRFTTTLRALLAGLLILVGAPTWAAFETAARTAIVVDLGTNTVLLEKDADTPLPPASMSKLMTLNMLFEALRDGRVGMDTEFGISTKAHRMGGSKMFLREGGRVAVKDLIPGIIVASGNDACVVVAEGLAGSEEAFARLMNQRAEALGMTGSTFANASGWPHPAHRMSARDLAFLAGRLFNEFPEFYGYFSQESFEWEGIDQANRNPLLGLGIGADGLKTGHTQEAGYGLVGSAAVGKRRIAFVISGLDSAADRAREAEQLVNWSFRQFVEKDVIKGGTEFARPGVWMGDATNVGLIAPDDQTLLLPALAQGELAATIHFSEPLQAPIAKGDVLGRIVVAREGMEDATFPLIADADVARGGFLPRIKSASSLLLGMVVERVGSLF